MKVIAGLLLMLYSLHGYAEESPVVSTRTLSPSLAVELAHKAYKYCEQQGYHVAVSVVDRSGNLLSFIRDPLAGHHTIAVSQRKAYTAATYQTATSRMLDRVELMRSPGVLLLGGGLPINVAGHFYGAVAVSGAPAEKTSGDIDEACAAAGIAAIEEALQFAQ